MRLIDADALTNQKPFTAIDGSRCDYVDGFLGCAEEARETIKNAPTIDPESLRPVGEWIERPTGRYGAWQSWCSVCGKHSGIGGIESNRHKPYCPNCGAKMKKDGDADD